MSTLAMSTAGSGADDPRDTPGVPGILDGLTRPLRFPGRALSDLRAVGDAARGLSEFERRVLVRLDEISVEVNGLRRDLAATRLLCEELRDQVDGAVEHLPGHDDDQPSGPIARVVDAISGDQD